MHVRLGILGSSAVPFSLLPFWVAQPDREQILLISSWHRLLLAIVCCLLISASFTIIILYCTMSQ
ncbi:hypothetical protein B0O99DRAFT_353173 [Bisporella sp. PMI_857]|nr:hypothetical protein B0O99DRAFT_353173 [Bisporella sp. PMI_857]